MLGFPSTRQRYYRYYLLSMICAALLLSTRADVAGCCDVDCPFESENCTDPCDTQLDTDYYLDFSCSSRCCDWGQCFILERTLPQNPCTWICAADHYAKCAIFSSSCGP